MRKHSSDTPRTDALALKAGVRPPFAETVSAEFARRMELELNELAEALREIEVICTESAADCRKRMGTRVGNALVVARAAISKAEGK